MARTVLVLRIDNAPALAAIQTMQEIHGALASRHGDRFRAMDRRIQAVLDGEVQVSRCHDMPIDKGEDPLLVFGPSDQVSAILRDARAMGLLR